MSEPLTNEELDHFALTLKILVQATRLEELIDRVAEQAKEANRLRQSPPATDADA